MTTGTTANTRTLRAYAVDLLHYARWIIERDVDFSDCRHGGRYESSASECAECRFGTPCRWLDQQRTPILEDASLDEMIEALETACQYFESTHQGQDANDPELRDWIHKTHRFLKARSAQ